MTNLHKAVSFTTTFGISVLALVVFNSQPAYGQAAIPVRITNIPLPVTGTVAVSSLPAVTLSGTPAVNLNSTANTPVYVDADRSARNGFNASCATGPLDSSGQAQCLLLTIPEGRKVVIESVSCQASLAAGQGPGDVQLILPNVPFGGGATTNVSHLLALSKQAGDASVDIWRMTTPLRAYASAPTSGSVGVFLFFRANPTSPQPQGILCAISGYAIGQ
jgi:hypothetical protein